MIYDIMMIIMIYIYDIMNDIWYNEWNDDDNDIYIWYI